MSRSFVCFLLIIAAGLGLRCPQLDRRPMHNDEAVNALKLQTLWEKGSYIYDPNEYHGPALDRKSTRLNSSHMSISYAVFCLKKKKKTNKTDTYNKHRVT